MAFVDEMYDQALTADYSVDIREHLPTLREYASRCDVVTELGVRWVVSTWAFLAARPKVLRSFDIVPVGNYGRSEESIKAAAEEVNVLFTFYNENVLTTENITDTDMLFIDTLHSYKQLKLELHLHGNKAKKYIAFHDIVTFGESDEMPLPVDPNWPGSLKELYRNLPEGFGINKAIVEFMVDNKHWRADRLFSNNNGLLILTRLNNA